MTTQIPVTIDCGGLILYSVAAEQKHPMRRHVEIELNIITGGTATLVVGERKYELRRNSQVWLASHQDHLLLDQSHDYSMWVGLFTPEFVRQNCTSAEARPLVEAGTLPRFYRQLSEQQARWLGALFSQVVEDQADSALHKVGVTYALLTAWSAYLAADAAVTGSAVHLAVERAAHILRDETEPLRIDELATRVGLSPSRLSKLFGEQMGISLSQFRNKQRLERFLQLYGEDRRMTALEAAMDAGFGSYAQFYRVFMQMMRCSPLNYRGQQRGCEHDGPRQLDTGGSADKAP